MAKKTTKIPKPTPEEIAEREEFDRLGRERIAERRALEREREERQKHAGFFARIRRSLRAAW